MLNPSPRVINTHVLRFFLKRGGRGKVFAFNFNSSCLCSPLLILCDVSVSNLGELWSQKGISICQFIGVGENTQSSNRSYAHLNCSQSEANSEPAQFVCVFHCRPVTFIVSPLTSQHLVQIAAYIVQTFRRTFHP